MPVEAASPDGSISSACSVLPTLPVLTWAFRTFRPAGMLTWYQAVCPVLVARPLPPVRVPVNVVDGSGVGTCERRVTGMEVSAAKAGDCSELSRTMEPATAPGWDGVA